ncbi:uncharacterized protein SAPINGB_P006274 [Magnusiomyces paraingens]|uniref:Vacuolar transporter chaperone complex subunit 4 n=1 Tax=Magnusiomyces paraingens TaxID=2606893 RepID=A0A5E8C9A1_9ASCO|nr:uncharacterized protein SAPINGB_P006274 [Saprochaete ingens]VVT58568.1 unnamed protein product [Saprochaete ingens]
MKFGEQLKSSLIRDYYYYYISYDDLKADLKKTLKQHSWTEKDEERFVGLLEAELDKVYTFQKVKNGEIARRIKDAEREVNAVVHQLDLNDPPTEQQFEDLEEELSDIIADVHDLAKFTRLNYTGFQKIIKKHDKQTNWTLKPIFSVRLNAKPFFKDNYDVVVVKISKLYDLVRTRGNPVRGDSAAGGAQQNFVRQTTKYWVHPDNITELKLIILKHLPVLVFNSNKEFEVEDSAITSIYYDNRDLDLYKGRLEKNEGAEALRLRWYGGMKSDLIFVERKTHREDWTGEKSVKARFPLKEKHVNDFMVGKYTVAQAFEKARKEGKKPLKEIESLEALAREVQYSVLTRHLRPVMRSFYNRTAFQLPGDARVRISLDTELTMVREDNFDGYDRTHRNWRRMDIGVDWPFNQLPPKDVERFPYAVLEVKLQTQMGQEPPQWVRELVASHLVEAVPKFSKFIHGCATLLPDMVTQIPFWLPQMDVDIRKPIMAHYGIEHPAHYGSSISGGSDDAGYFDEEELVGDGVAAAAGSVVRFDSDANAPTSSTSENAPLLAHSVPKPKNTFYKPVHFENLPPALGSTFSALYNPIANFFFDVFIKQVDVSTIPAGTEFISDIKVPKGKRICVPVRVEPKVYFANERTFLSWMHIAIFLSTIAGGLLNFGQGASLEASLGFFLTAALTIIYGLFMYLWRRYHIRHKDAVRYDDMIGPTLICGAIFLSTAANFYFRYTQS